MKVVKEKTNDAKVLYLLLIILGLLCMLTGLFVEHEDLICQIAVFASMIGTLVWGLVLYFGYGITARDSRAYLINSISIFTLVIMPADVFFADNRCRWPLSISFMVSLIMWMLFRLNKNAKNKLFILIVFITSMATAGLCVANFIGYIQSLSYCLIGIYDIFIMLVFKYIMSK
jgi:hypothetical protein